MLKDLKVVFFFGSLKPQIHIHAPKNILQMAVQNYNIVGSTVIGSGIGPDPTLRFSLLTNQRTLEQTSVANPSEVPIHQIIVQTGDTPQNLTTKSFVTELPFKIWSPPLASDLHALAILLFRDCERLFHIVFFLLNVFQH